MVTFAAISRWTCSSSPIRPSASPSKCCSRSRRRPNSSLPADGKAGSLKLLQHIFAAAHVEGARLFDIELRHHTILDEHREALAARSHAELRCVHLEADCAGEF